MKKKIAFWLDKNDPAYPEVMRQLVRVNYVGYSVVELSRLLNRPNCRYLYRILCEAGILPRLPRGKRAKFDLPTEFAAVLNMCGLSFPAWCNCHRLNPLEALDELKNIKEANRDVWSLTYDAVKNDFPIFWEKNYGPAPYQAAPSGRPLRKELRTKHSVYVVFDHTTNRYRAFIPEMEGYFAEGDTMDEAWHKLKRRYIILVTIAKLTALPPK